MGNELTNLNKYISSSGFCSRREADKLIEQARVTVNGELVLPGARVSAGDVIEVDGEPIKTSKKRPIYIAFNKPVGITSTTDIKDKSNIIYFIGHPKRIFPIGRLDKDSDGLIFLTNDGDIVNKILRASNNHEKEYIVTVDKAITPEFVRQMSTGVPVERKMTKPCFVRQEGGRRFRIILTQGLNRQIRHMCDYLGFRVVSLSRIRIMNVELDSLPTGKWRYLTLPEIEKLNKMVAESSKTDTASKSKSKPTKDGAAPVQYIPKKRKAGEAGKEAMTEKGKEVKGVKRVKSEKPAGLKSERVKDVNGVKRTRSEKPGGPKSPQGKAPKGRSEERGRGAKEGKYKEFKGKKPGRK